MKGPIVKKPIGPSELGKGFGTCWNNRHLGPDGPITCEICGTEHPKRKDESYIVSWFLGLQVVEECCGAILDRIYQESGEEFAAAFLQEFAENPTSPRFHVFLTILTEACEKAQKTTLETAQQLQKDNAKLRDVAEIAKA